ncbi:Pentatricopeptide repeat-containing protein [Striga hermonthica]|uniref:Pentatricopeptide repeat-containing protein n=1 Tax=Striga hermonthica TaxID=68872 RepID=A0A9N7R6X7_STRHE|nr:Pentatricopeptide repeat-containing protein [Striga hermonthica]
MVLRASGGGSSTDHTRSVQPFRSSCKLQSLSPPFFRSSLFVGFNKPRAPNNLPRYTNIRHAKNKSLVPFKLQCHSQIVASPDKNVNNNNKGRKKNKYGGNLPSILRALEVGVDFEKTLDSYHGKLGPKEQTVILKEQGKWDKVLRVFEWFKSHEDYVPNVIHYNIVLRELGRAKKWDELRLCWIEMAKKGVLPTNNTYSMLIDVYGKAGLVKEALLWIKHMKSRGIFPDEVTLSTVIKVLKDAKEYDRAHRFYEDWCAGKINVDDLDLDSMGDQQSISLKQFLMSELFRTGGRSHHLTNDIDSCVRKPRLTATYNTLIDLYGKAGLLKDAANVFSDMLNSGAAPDTFTFNTMIYICGSQGHLSEAKALLTKMEERGVSPDTKTYNIILSLHASAGDIDAVLRSYRRIREVGLFPDGVTYRAVLKILGEKNMVQDVDGVIQEMEKMGKSIDESSLPVLINMYVGAGLREKAKALVEKCKSYGVQFSSKVYAAIIDVYADKGLWAEAEALFYSKCQHKDVLEYNVMIKAYGKAKLYEKAVTLFRGMRNQGIWPDECTYNSLIQMLAGGDLVDSTRAFLVEMQEEAGFRPNCLTFAAFIACLARNKMLTEAVEVFEKMLKADVKPNEVVYGTLIDGFADEGNFEEAARFFRAMEDSQISPNQIVLTSMIKAYGKIGSVEGATRIYERMKKIYGDGLDIVVSNSMLYLYGEMGMLSEAEALYDHLIEKNQADGVTYTTMFYVYRNMGMLDESVEVARKMKQSGLVTNCVTYNKLMACFATNGQLLECGELLHEMVMDKKLSPDEGTFKVLFTVLKKGGFPGEAVQQLESSYKERKPFTEQAVIISIFSAVGLHEYALKSCGAFAKEGLRLNSFVCSAAIRAYTAYGKINQGLNIFMRMQREGVKPDILTLISLVSCYGKGGMVEGIMRVESHLKYGLVEASESLYKAVVDAYRNADRPDLAELASEEMKIVLSDADRLFMDSESEDTDETFMDSDSEYDEDDDISE